MNYEQGQRTQRVFRLRDDWKEYWVEETQIESAGDETTFSKLERVMGRVSTFKIKKDGSTPLFSTPPRLPTEVNLVILITVNGNLEETVVILC